MIFLVMVKVCTAQKTTARERINFDENWRFALGSASSAAKDFNYGIANLFSKTGKAEDCAVSNKFNDSSWRKLDLPHDWAVELPFVQSNNFEVVSHGFKPVSGLYPETSIGWYRKHFSVSAKDSGNLFTIQFDGVYRDASVWLNGFYLGNHKSGYTGVEYDLTPYLNYGKENVLVVRVDASQYEGWFYEGAGIYRHVWLNKKPTVYIATDGVYAYSTITKEAATIHTETTIKNSLPNNISYTTVALLKDRTGKTVASAAPNEVVVKAYSAATTNNSFTINNPILWDIDNPYLYHIVTQVFDKQKLVDEHDERFGIRAINITDSGVYLNSKHVKIKGTNNHQDHAGVGSALPDYLQYYRIGLLKQMGANAYRTSHHAPTPELLDACDSLGMLVLDENRLLNISEQYIQDWEWQLKRDRSRASVFLWSIGNEEGWVQGNNIGKAVAQQLIAKQRELDPTRVSTYAADMGNVYPGINEVIPVRGFNYREYAVSDYHKDHPLQSLIGTEMGSTVTTRGIYKKDTARGYVPDQDITAPWWASTAETWWKLAADAKFWLGGFIWTGFDYRGEPTPYEWPNVNSHFGVMDVCGFPKNIYYYYQSWWKNEDVLHVSPHWNWKGKENEPIDVWVNSNADNIELLLNNNSLGTKQMPANGHLQWSVPYKAGTLKAIAHKGKKTFTQEISTTGTAYSIKLECRKVSLKADGKDATVVNITVLDNKGREVPDADNLIHFKLSGNAKIIGVGNGDPSSHEADKYFTDNWQRHLFNGKAQVIIQSGKEASNIQLTITSEGLIEAGLGISGLAD
jgi:beta-galactosidase